MNRGFLTDRVVRGIWCLRSLLKKYGNRNFNYSSISAVLRKVPDEGGFAFKSYIGLKRKIAVKEKLNPIRSAVEGKDIILLDDSIVRGTTTQQIVLLLKEVGRAKTVHLRIGCPPIISPCYMGIDFPTKEELIASRFLRIYGEGYIEEIRKQIGADSLLYQTREDLFNALCKTENQLCMACLTGNYPLKSVEKLSDMEKSISKSRI